MPGPPGVFRRRKDSGHLDPGQGIIEVLPFVGSQVNKIRLTPRTVLDTLAQRAAGDARASSALGIHHPDRGGGMNSTDLKKLLAGLGVAGLIAGGISMPGAHAAGSG